MAQLFNVADRDEYLAYSRRLGGSAGARRACARARQSRETAAPDIKPRSVMILVEWAWRPSLPLTNKGMFESDATTAS
jgi:hypothetical protein